MKKVSSFFDYIANKSAYYMGVWQAFIIATVACLIWAISGPFFDYSDTWQLVINTGTTILTFLAVFLIQNAQNRGDKALQLKLDEILIALSDARESDFVDLENKREEDIAEIEKTIHKEVEEEVEEEVEKEVEKEVEEKTD